VAVTGKTLRLLLDYCLWKKGRQKGWAKEWQKGWQKGRLITYHLLFPLSITQVLAQFSHCGPS